MQTEILTNKQYRILSKKLINTIEKNYKIIPLNSLKHPNYILKKPIYITIETENATTIASLDDIEAFAYADTEFEAINALCEDIINIYEDLKEDADKLGMLPGKWLKYLDEIIESK